MRKSVFLCMCSSNILFEKLVICSYRSQFTNRIAGTQEPAFERADLMANDEIEAYFGYQIYDYVFATKYRIIFQLIADTLHANSLPWSVCVCVWYVLLNGLFFLSRVSPFSLR